MGWVIRKARRCAISVSRGPPIGRAARQAFDAISSHGDAVEHIPLTLPEDHLRTLVLIEAGERRWHMGLTELASRLYLSRDAAPLSDLESWGYISDMADDDRWRYYLAPTVLGRNYLRRCPETKRLRAEVWQREIDRHEVPDDVDQS